MERTKREKRGTQTQADIHPIHNSKVRIFYWFVDLNQWIRD